MSSGFNDTSSLWLQATVVRGWTERGASSRVLLLDDSSCKVVTVKQNIVSWDVDNTNCCRIEGLRPSAVITSTMEWEK